MFNQAGRKNFVQIRVVNQISDQFKNRLDENSVNFIVIELPSIII